MKAGLIITFFLTFYLVFGITLFVQTGTINGTNDFIFHFHKAQGTIDAPIVSEFYSTEAVENYPSLLHLIATPFAQNELLFYTFAVLLVCLIFPTLLWKLAGDFAVIVYFALSFPHMILFNATFASFLIMIYVLLYLFKRKNVYWFVTLGALALMTHKSGAIVFGLIAIAEFIYSQKQNFNLAGLLVGTKATSATQAINLFLNHLNLYFIWIARKNFNTFYLTLFIAGIIGAFLIDFRTVILSQTILCIAVGETIQKQKPTKIFWITTILFTVFNLFSFCLETAKFIFL